jgi:hypothetical protein
LIVRPQAFNGFDLTSVASKNVVAVTCDDIERPMSKLIGLLLILAMAVHIIMPLGLPGLKRRGDFWKIAIVAFAIWSIALVFREVF